ncbi:MAG TPA: helix-turn-helix transcriptional regulator [Steroidobacteraceae bacterium]|nr:helix-turn-helix transcriptional regulator [Steroidobacteraceae bacterium]
MFRSLLSVTSFTQIQDEMLTPLARIVGATSGVFVQFLGLPYGGDAIGQFREIGCGRHTLDEYVEGLYALDPMVQPGLQWLSSEGGPAAAAIGLLSDIEDWRDRREYRRFLERLEIADVLAIGMQVRTVLGPQCVCLGFHRGHGHQPFDERDLRALRGYIPALQPVISNLVHHETAQKAGVLLDTIAMVANAPEYLVLDEDLRVRHASQDALARLGLDAGNSRSGKIRENTFGELRMQLLGSLKDNPRTESITLSRMNGSTDPNAEISVNVKTLHWLDGSNALLLTLNRACGSRGFEMACREFELSGRERDVALAACRGLQNAAIARRLGITARTVENHLRSIYAKLGVSSRSQMIAQLLKLN